MDQQRTHSKELGNICDALAKSVLEMSDEEILAEAQDDGDDIATAAEEVRQVLRASLKAHKQRRLIEAHQQYEEKMLAMFQREYSLPVSPEDKRALFLGVLNTNPQVNSALTMQHRNFKELSDEDIESYLKQFVELGILKTHSE